MPPPTYPGPAPPIHQPRSHYEMLFLLLGLVVGWSIALLSVRYGLGSDLLTRPAMEPVTEPLVEELFPYPLRYPTFLPPGWVPQQKLPPAPARLRRLGAPPAPRIDPLNDLPAPPVGRPFEPLEPEPFHGLDGPPGVFRHEGVAFRFPERWEHVPSGGHYGLAGNILWTAPIGIDHRNHLQVVAMYFPWDYSDTQLLDIARSAVQMEAAPQDGRILRAVSAVRTAGVRTYWADIAIVAPTGPSLMRMYLLPWNDTLYLFACKQHLDDDARILRGCDTVMSTLELGVYEPGG